MTFDLLTWLDQTNTLIVIAGVVGGAIVKGIEKIISRRAIIYKESEKIRQELREELEALKKELRQTTDDADTWRKKYWDEVEKSITDHLPSSGSLK